jgi:hypothetical protein
LVSNYRGKSLLLLIQKDMAQRSLTLLACKGRYGCQFVGSTLEAGPASKEPSNLEDRLQSAQSLQQSKLHTSSTCIHCYYSFIRLVYHCIVALSPSISSIDPPAPAVFTGCWGFTGNAGRRQNCQAPWHPHKRQPCLSLHSAQTARRCKIQLDYHYERQ